MSEPHACDEFCVCPVHRTPTIYAPGTDDHACLDVTCEYGHGTWRVQAQIEFRRAERVVRDYRALTDEVIAGLSTDAHRIVIEGGLPFCSCRWPLLSGDRDSDFITHAIRVVQAERARAVPDGGRAEVEWAVWRGCGLAGGKDHRDGDHDVAYRGGRAGAWAMITRGTPNPAEPSRPASGNLVMVAREVACGPWTKVEP